MTEEVPPPLETSAYRPHWLMWVVFFCGLFPLVLNSIFVMVYAQTYQSWVPTAELVLLVCTPGFLVAGGACLSMANAPSRRPRSGVALEIFNAAFWRRVGVLLINIPAAIGCGFLVNMLENDTVVGVINETGAVIERCEIIAVDSVDRRTRRHAMIAPGDSVRSDFSLDEEATVKIRLQQAGASAEFELVGHPRLTGAKQRVLVSKGLKWRVVSWDLHQ